MALNGSLTQNGNNLTGNVTITNPLGTANGVLTGQVNGKNLSFTVTATSGTRMSIINFKGIIIGNKALSGSYLWPELNDKGSWLFNSN
jgi:hypothetical protein